jgi:Putative peptidoglycan binding domain
VRKRRNEHRGFAARAAAMAGALGAVLWTRLARRPVDSVALLLALATSLIIIVNALVLQSGAHPAPFVAAPALPAPAAAAQRGATGLSPADGPIMAHPLSSEVAARPNDPIAQFIGMSSRTMAVQRALSDYGYGQIRPSGILDEPTGAAIERFEREHGLPVTGKISDRLVSELSAMIGHPLD